MKNLKKHRQLLLAAGIALVYVLFTAFMFANAGLAARGGASLSLRYYSPLSAGQVAHAKYLAKNPELTLPFFATYWYESPQETISTTRSDVNTATLFVDGDMSCVYPVQFLYGGYPAALERRGLALSQQLAWKLFGGLDVVGSQVEWKGAMYTVRGVFKGSTDLLLAQIAAEDGNIQAFSGVQLSGTVENSPRKEAEAFLVKLGLGTPSTIISAQLMPGIMLAMAYLPACFLLAWFALRLLMMVRHIAYWQRQLIFFGALFALAILLPKALALLPHWVVPTKWSDFEHWSTFFKELNARFTQQLALQPNLGDVQHKKQLILQLLLLFPALFTLLGLMHRWGAYMHSKALPQAGQGSAATLPSGGKSEDENTPAAADDAAFRLGAKKQLNP